MSDYIDLARILVEVVGVYFLYKISRKKTGTTLTINGNIAPHGYGKHAIESEN